ncbi:MAG: hypothetical protein OIN85_01070 [Candidatus Methanoperedens sp.]|nr:hypothetical protein [Candidatus Methanoperedens sp.]
MSILSCERLESGGFVVEVTEKDHSLHVDFAIGSIVPNSTNTTNSITIQNNAGVVQIENGQGYIADQPGNYVINNNMTFWNNSTMFQVVGYKFFFLNGFLKCVKKEIAASNVYANTTAVSSTAPAPVFSRGPHRNSLCEPYELVGTLTNRRMIVCVQAKLLALAERKGISVPRKYVAQPEPVADQIALKPFFALFDWLAYPLFREIDSLALAHNLNTYARKLMCPVLKPMNFKDLVEFYYGTSTAKMLEEIWKVITWGGEFRRFQFSASTI